MHRSVQRGLIALISLLSTSPAWPQAISHNEVEVGQPTARAFFNGAEPTAPAVERQLAVTAPYRAYLPASVDLSSTMPAVGDQGPSQSCAAWSIAYAARSHYTTAIEKRDVHQPINLPSPSYIFQLAREGDWGCVQGTNIVRVVDVLKKGALSMAEYPYSPACRAPASPDLIAKATDFRVADFNRVEFTKLDDVRGQLSLGNPIIIRFHDSIAFHKHSGPGTFGEAVLDPKAPDVGWHFITVVGYDDQRQAVRIINSWGTNWGDKGYAWLSYDVLTKGRVTNAYVLALAETTPVASSRQPSRPAASAMTSKSESAISSDTLKSELQGLACSRVTVSTRGDHAVLSGFVSSADDLEAVKALASRSPGATVGEVTVAPWPYCELLQTLDRPLAAGDLPKLTVGPAPALREGDTLRIEVRSPSQPSYVYVSVLKPDGSVVNLAQAGDTTKPVAANGTLTFGEDRTSAPLTVGRPFGRDIVVALAARTPLFDQPLAATQTEREYLTALRRALMFKPSPDAPEHAAAAAVATVETRAKDQ